MISACRRDMSLPVTTTWHVASRPNTREAPATAYSGPSVKLTTRPPVLPVLPPFPFAACAIICGRFTASTYCVLPERRSSTNVNSFGPTCTLSPCRSGVGSAPRRTPLMRTSASGTALRITTWPSGVPSNSACLGSTSAPPTCMAQPASLPNATVPGGIVNFLPPSSSNAIGSVLRGKAEQETTPGRVTTQPTGGYVLSTSSSMPIRPRRNQRQNSTDPKITVASLLMNRQISV